MVITLLVLIHLTFIHQIFRDGRERSLSLVNFMNYFTSFFFLNAENQHFYCLSLSQYFTLILWRGSQFQYSMSLLYQYPNPIK